MNKLQYNRNRSRLVIKGVVASIFFGLAICTLIARPHKNSRATPGQCAEWPCKDGAPGCQDIQKRVKKVFEKLIDDASTGTEAGKELRRKLVDPADGHQKAREIARERLKSIVSLGDEHLVVFYEPENEMTKSYEQQISRSTTYPNNHCFHIFYLPKEPKRGMKARPAYFNRNLKCCYQPW